MSSTRSSQTVARSGDDDTYGDHYPVAVAGIGPVAGTRIPLAGPCGGGLRAFTPDGWRVAVIAPDWPDEKGRPDPRPAPPIRPPTRPPLRPPISARPPTPAADPTADPDPGADPDAALIIHDDDPIRTAGFSDSGRVLVVARNSG
ncbi:hypothetical protein [Actinoplanes sp. NPDC026623]|uniref:hypothetical protein n=1 Tax=Actinoplanes sp. NPDC026623 TaxID=3155610 RepID=UPI0033C9C417